jgi:hypothetical protein
MSLLLCMGVGKADEGFWLPGQLGSGSTVLDAVNVARTSMGLALPLEKIQAATVRLNGCSGAFISATGLLITSHHCIEPYLQLNNDSAFVAENFASEQPVSALTLDVLQQVQDVTVVVNRQLNMALTEQARNDKLQDVSAQLLAACEQGTMYRCELRSLHHGLEFYLAQYKTLQDIRLVFKPALMHGSSIRSWPRYDADYVLLRAYVSADKSEGLPYAFDNKPYHASFVTLSQHGVSDQELVLSTGFSVQSQRYATVAEIRFQFEYLYPRSIEHLQQAVLLIEQMAPAGSQRELQYQATLTEMKQQLAKLRAMLERYQHGSLLQTKQQHQLALRQWIDSSAVRQQLYSPILERLRQLLARQQAAQQRDQILGYLRYAQLPALANQLYRLALVPDAGQQQQLHQQMRAIDSQFDSRVDLELALHFLGQYAQLSPDMRLPALDQYFALSDGFNREIVRHKLSAMYRFTGLTDANQRELWLERSAEQFQQSTDPMLSFAVAMHDTATWLAGERAKLNTDLNSARSALMEVLIAFNDAHGKETYAAPNHLPYVSLGRVSGYQPMDAVWYQPFSSLQGLLHSRRAQDGSIPSSAALEPEVAAKAVNFLSTTDSCSEYSAAATFNTAGELVGVMYAGGQDNLLADWQYDATLSRTVHVDSRYIIWQLQQTAAGRALLSELLPAQ